MTDPATTPTTAAPDAKWRVVVRLLGHTLVFLVALVLSFVLHLDTHAGRTALTHLANRALQPIFEGSLVIESIDDVSIDTIAISRVLVVDPNAERVLQLRSVHVALDPADLLLSYLDESTQAVTYTFPHLRAEEAEVLLLRDAQSGVSLARALTPKPLTTTPKASELEPSTTRLWFPNIELGRVQGSFDLPVLEHLLPRLVAVRGSLMVSPNGVAVDVERFGMVVAGLPGGIHGTGTVKVRVPGAIQVEFSGYVNDSEAQATFELDDDVMDVSLVSPSVSSQTLRAFFPAWPIAGGVTLQAHANGTLPYLDIDVQTTLPPSNSTVQVPLPEQAASFSTEARLDLSTGVDLTLVSKLSNFSLAELDANWPESNIGALMTTQLRYHDDEFEQETDGYVPSFTLYDQQLPELSFTATTRNARTTLEVEIDEPGAPGTVSLQYLHTGELDATIAIPKLTLRNQRRLPANLSGQASVEGKVKVRGAQLVVDANVNVVNLSTEGFSAGRLAVQARTEQSLDNPTGNPVRVGVSGNRVSLAGLAWESTNASATVTLDGLDGKLQLQDPHTGSVAASASYDFATGVLRNVKASVDRAGLRATMQLPLIDPYAPNVELKQLEIVRPGCLSNDDCPHISASGAYTKERVRARVDAEHVHLERLGPLFGQKLPIYGKVDVELDVDSAPDALSVLEVHGKDVSFQGYGHGDVDSRITLSQARLNAALSATNSLGVSLEAEANAELHGTPLDAETWKNLTGSAAVRGKLAQLETLQPLLQQAWLQSLSGQSDFLVTVARRMPKERPAVAAELKIHSLDLAAKPSDEAEPIVLEHHNLYANATYDADANVLYGSALLQDAAGPLLRLKNATVPLPGLSAASATRPTLLANITLEPRDAQQLPYLKNTPLSGALGAELTLYGTLEQPEAKLLVVGSKLSMPGLDPTLPVDLSGNVHYRLSNHELAVDIAAATDRKTVLVATLDGTFDPAKAYAGTARVLLDDMPLALVSVVGDLDIDGNVTGLFELAPNPTPHARLALQFSNLASGRALIGDGKLQGDLAPGRLAAQFSVTNTEHSILLSLDALSPPERLPTLATVNHVRALVKTRQMNAAALSPLLKGLVARLGGNLDSDVSLEWEKDNSGSQEVWSNRVSGVAHLRNGRAYVDGLGLELQDITADAVATPLGANTHLALDRIEAKARSREVNFQGRGQLVFDGASVVSGSANIVLRDVPLTLQGLNLGKASGTASADLKRVEGWPTPPHEGKPYLLVNATLADFNLNAARTASRSLIDTNPNSEIDVVQNKPIVRNEDVLPYRIYVDLGRDARFSLADLDIPLSGVTQIDYTNESVLSGTIVLKPGGRIPLLGRLFEVQEGNLRLNPDEPSNPYIDISLTGRSKDGDPLDVTLAGTLQQPIVSPTLARLQELLGGGAASALSGGFQALGLASMLGDAVQLRVGSDAADENLARYSAAVEVRENLWFEVNYQRNDTAAFQTKNEGAISGTLDYRLNDNWSLRTEAGTAGGSVDVVWQFRY